MKKQTHHSTSKKIYILDGETEDEIRILPFKTNLFKKHVCYFFFIISFGLLPLVLHWRPLWYIRLSCDRIPYLHSADVLIIIDRYGCKQITYVKTFIADQCAIHNTLNQHGKRYLIVPQRGGSFRYVTEQKYFKYHGIYYIWRDDILTYDCIKHFTSSVFLSSFAQTQPLTMDEQNQRRLFFGLNDIAVKVKPIWYTLFYEVLTPFYIFQIFSIVLWYNDEYELYATCIFIISIISLIQSTYEIRKDQKALNKLAKLEATCTLLVRTTPNNDPKTSFMVDNNIGIRNFKQINDVPCTQLVPGDVIIIPTKGCTMTCDALLLTGSCIVNESMLTGESVPVTKTPPPDILQNNQSAALSNVPPNGELNPIPPSAGLSVKGDTFFADTFDRKHHSKHMLFCGTKVIQSRFYGSDSVKAVVIATGFNTTKGEIIRSIMYPKPCEFNFNQDSYKFIAALFGIALIGFIYSSTLKILNHVSVRLIILRSIDLVTIVVPPALPAAMTIGIVFAKNRLKKRDIFCVSPSHINVSGVLNLFCFDKTGTLTEDGLDIHGILPVMSNKKSLQKSSSANTIDGLLNTESQIDTNIPIFGSLLSDALVLNDHIFDSDGIHLLHCLATCHALTTIDGELLGDPLDVKMFQCTGWDLKEPSVDDSQKYDILIPTIVYNNGKRVHDGLSNTSFNIDESTDIRDSAMCEIGIIRQFPFVSSLQRQSVVVCKLERNHDSLTPQRYEFYCKGSPEQISKLCRIETLPVNYAEQLHLLTDKGYRVIGLGWKELPPDLKWAKIQRINRDQIENDLQFLGFLIFENKLKPATAPTLDVLRRANIRITMITGDNLLTAVSVAKESGLIETNSMVKEIRVQKDPRYQNFDMDEYDGPMNIKLHDIYEHATANDSSSPGVSTPSKCDRKHQSYTSTNKISFRWKFIFNRFKTRLFLPKTPSHLCENGDYEYSLRHGSNRNQHLVMTGDTFQALLNHEPHNLDKLLAPSILGHLDLDTLLPLATNENMACHKKCFSTATIFARMTPDQKAALVERFQSLGYYVGMCGDGANDCGALKTAHAGLALSDNEASLVAHFASTRTDITGTLGLIAEGRAALVTSFGVFKYMAFYSLIQFVSVLLLYWIGASFSDQQFSYVDLCIITLHALTFGHTRAYGKRRKMTTNSHTYVPDDVETNKSLKTYAQEDLSLAKNQSHTCKANNNLTKNEKQSFKTMLLHCVSNFKPNSSLKSRKKLSVNQESIILARKPPDSSLVSFVNVFSILSQLTIQTIFMVIIYYWVRSQPWFVPYDPKLDPEEEFFSHTVTSIFYITAFQYIILAHVASKGPPYRQPVYTNIWFVASTLISILFTAFILLLFPPTRLARFFYLELLPFYRSTGHSHNISLPDNISLNQNSSFVILQNQSISTISTPLNIDFKKLTYNFFLSSLFGPRMIIIYIAIIDCFVSIFFDRLVVQKIIGTASKGRDFLLRKHTPRYKIINTITKTPKEHQYSSNQHYCDNKPQNLKIIRDTNIEDHSHRPKNMTPGYVCPIRPDTLEQKSVKCFTSPNIWYNKFLAKRANKTTNARLNDCCGEVGNYKRINGSLSHSTPKAVISSNPSNCSNLSSKPLISAGYTQYLDEPKTMVEQEQHDLFQNNSQNNNPNTTLYRKPSLSEYYIPKDITKL